MTATGRTRRGAALDALASEIREQTRLAERHWNEAIHHAIRAGELLIEAKAQVRHGEWGPWLKENFPASERTARLYMRLARERQLVADLPTLREAIDTLTKPAKPAEYERRRLTMSGIAGIPPRNPSLVNPNAPDKPHPKYLAASNDPWVTVCPCCGHDLYAPMAPTEP